MLPVNRGDCLNMGMRDALEQRDFCTAAAAFSSGVAEKLKAFRPEVALSCQFDLCPPSDGCAGASQQNSCTSRDVWPATATQPNKMATAGTLPSMPMPFARCLHIPGREKHDPVVPVADEPPAAATNAPSRCRVGLFHWPLSSSLIPTRNDSDCYRQ